MKKIKAFVNQYPVLIQGAIQSGITFAVAFGLKLTVAQIGAILMVSAAVLSIITHKVVNSGN